MALIVCKDCQKEFSTDAKRCPNCGAKKPPKDRSKLYKGIAIFFLLTQILRLFASHDSPVPTTSHSINSAHEVSPVTKAAAAVSILKNSMKDPDSFRLEQALLINKTGAVCFTYRAKNGFGALDVGHAVMGRNGVGLLDHSEPGFSALWNKECNGKKGTDEKDDINQMMPIVESYIQR